MGKFRNLVGIGNMSYKDIFDLTANIMLMNYSPGSPEKSLKLFTISGIVSKSARFRINSGLMVSSVAITKSDGGLACLITSSRIISDKISRVITPALVAEALAGAALSACPGDTLSTGGLIRFPGFDILFKFKKR